jgi:rRNA small subunit pseudouridine methyltransferase Nep1
MAASGKTPQQVIVVLEQACLEIVKTKKVCADHRSPRRVGTAVNRALSPHPVVLGQGFELLNCDEHLGAHKKAGRDPADSRPDITHQLLMALLDSPLNKAGRLRIYMQTKQNVLIEVHASTRIPRTFKRFAGLMVQLLHKLRVRAADSSETLLKVIRNPVTAHLPTGAHIIGLEAGALLIDAVDLPARLPKDRDLVFVVGAMSKGDISPDYTTETFSLSRYPLSAACSVSKLLNSFEHAWGVL